jgi:hypothetical protein
MADWKKVPIARLPIIIRPLSIAYLRNPGLSNPDAVEED